MSEFTTRLRCYKCGGTGWVVHHCGPPIDGRVVHPLNGRGYPPSFLYRCICGRYGRRFYEPHGDSIDLPGDELLGTERPPDDWEPEGGWNE
jgi:hypothetical protein